MEYRIMEPIAYFRSPFQSKFGIPRQSGLAAVSGEIHFTDKYRVAEALRGIEEFSYLWLIWEFSGNRNQSEEFSPTVRPPRLGGNVRKGVWATRSPFRPNNLGLSSVELVRVDWDKLIIHVSGADLMDGTPIYDIKPYLEYADSHPGAGNGFVDGSAWDTLRVIIPDEVKHMLESKGFDSKDIESLTSALSLDPRPRASKGSEERIFGFPFKGIDIHFTVSGDSLTLCL